MAIQHFSFTVYQHVTPGVPNDSANGFYVCSQTADYNDEGHLAPTSLDKPQPHDPAELLLIRPGAVNPFSTLQEAQSVIDDAVAYYSAQNHAEVAPGVGGSVDTLVAGPVLV